MIRVGLRFARKDAIALDALANRIMLAELAKGHLATFRYAADAARTGEPLIVQCNHPSEAQVMADGYARLGITRPAIEDLTGLRPAK